MRNSRRRWLRVIYGQLLTGSPRGPVSPLGEIMQTVLIPRLSRPVHPEMNAG